MTRADRKAKAAKRKPLGRRLGENIRAAGDLGHTAVHNPRELPGRAHGWFRNWFRRIWDMRGGGLYACGFAAAFLFLEVREFVLEDVAQFLSLNSYIGGELFGFVIQFFIDTGINFVKALMWPVFLVTLWPPVGAIALAIAFALFPHFVKPHIERWLFANDPKPDNP